MDEDWAMAGSEDNESFDRPGVPSRAPGVVGRESGRVDRGGGEAVRAAERIADECVRRIGSGASFQCAVVVVDGVELDWDETRMKGVDWVWRIGYGRWRSGAGRGAAVGRMEDERGRWYDRRVDESQYAAYRTGLSARAVRDGPLTRRECRGGERLPDPDDESDESRPPSSRLLNSLLRRELPNAAPTSDLRRRDAALERQNTYTTASSATTDRTGTGSAFLRSASVERTSPDHCGMWPAQSAPRGWRQVPEVQLLSSTTGVEPAPACFETSRS